MKVKIRKIGNSRGIIIPKSIVESCSLKDEAELTVIGNQLIVQSPPSSRDSWEIAFKEALEDEEKEGMIDDADLIQNDWDEEEWEW